MRSFCGGGPQLLNECRGNTAVCILFLLLPLLPQYTRFISDELFCLFSIFSVYLFSVSEHTFPFFMNKAWLFVTRCTPCSSSRCYDRNLTCLHHNRKMFIKTCITSFLSTQDSSEAACFWQPYGHPGGFPVDGDPRQGGHGPTALLHPHYDQNHLHQL